MNPAAILLAAEACDRWAPFLTVGELVERQYRDFYGRSADEPGLAYWSGLLESGRLTPHQFVGLLLTAREFEQRISPVARLYKAFFLRTPDGEGLDYWVALHSSGFGLTTIAQLFAESPEFVDRYGALSNAGFVDLVYRNVLGRGPDAVGNRFWLGALDRGRMTRGQVMAGFSESLEYRNLTAAWVRIVLIYVGMLDRAPDGPGLEYWLTQSPTVLVGAFWTSDEYRQRIEGFGQV